MSTPLLVFTSSVQAELNDVTQTPNTINTGIHKSLTDQIGAGLTDSCAACHGRSRGGAGFGGNVFTRPDSHDAPHLYGLGLVEMLGYKITAELRTLHANAIETAADTGGAGHY